MDLEVKHTDLVVPQNLTAHNNEAIGVETYMDPEEVEDFQRKTGQIEIQMNLKVKDIVSFKRFPMEDWTHKSTYGSGRGGWTGNTQQRGHRGGWTGNTQQRGHRGGWIGNTQQLGHRDGWTGNTTQTNGGYWMKNNPENTIPLVNNHLVTLSQDNNLNYNSHTNTRQSGKKCQNGDLYESYGEILINGHGHHYKLHHWKWCQELKMISASTKATAVLILLGSPIVIVEEFKL